MEGPLSSFSGHSQRDQAAGPLGLPGQLHGWSWDQHQDPPPALGLQPDPVDLISTELDKASPLRLSVVSLEDDQLRALAAELRRQGETVLVLDPGRQGLNDLARTLQQQGRHYDEIQIFGHGADDSFRVGRNVVSSRTLWRYSGALETIGSAIRPGGDLLLYGCNLAAGPKGKQLIERLATITGADVAASTDLTYAHGQSSDWDLEWSVGAIDDRAFHDLLTGLNWQGELGGFASISFFDSELNITEAIAASIPGSNSNPAAAPEVSDGFLWAKPLLTNQGLGNDFYIHADGPTLAFIGSEEANHLYLKDNTDVNDKTIEYSFDATSWWQLTGIDSYQSIYIDGFGGDDSITVQSLDSSFTGQLVIDAGSGTNLLRGPDAGASWQLAWNGAGSLSTSGSQSIQISFSGINRIEGGAGNDTLFGPATPSLNWSVTELDAGSVAGTAFSGFENLAGAANNNDSFVFEQAGSLHGEVLGGEGGYDTVVFQGSYAAVSHETTGPQSGIVDLDSAMVRYGGMEPAQFTGTTDVFTYVGTSASDTITISDLMPDVGVYRMQIAGPGETVQFANPTKSLIVKGLGGDDTIIVQSLDLSFSADLFIYGDNDSSNEGVDAFLSILKTQSRDKIVFAGSISTHGGKISAVADTATVEAGSHLSTSAVASNSGSINFQSRVVDLKKGSKLDAGVQNNSNLMAGNISLTSKAGSVVRTLDIPQPVSSINIDTASIIGNAIEITAEAAERFGVFGFRKDAAAQITLTDSSVVGNVVKLSATADTTLLPPTDVAMSGNPNLTFRHNPGAKDTIVRDSGTWSADGFLAVPGQSITVVGTPGNLNDGSYLVDWISGDTMTLKPDQVLVDQTAVPNVDLIGSLLVPDLEDLNDLAIPFTGSSIVTLSNAVATVDVLGASSLSSVGSTSIKAASYSRATPLGAGLAIPKAFGVAAAWADSSARATATIGGMTHVNAGGAVQIQALTENMTTATAGVMGNNKPASITFAGSKADSITTASLGDNTQVRASSLVVDASTTTDTNTGASVANTGASGASVAVALNLLQTSTTARVGGNVIATGDVVVTAQHMMPFNITDSEARNLGATDPLEVQINNQLNQFGRDQFYSLIGSNEAEASFVKKGLINKLFPVFKSGKLNISGALSCAEAENSVEASIADNAIIRASGDAKVEAALSENNNISAAAQTTSDKGEMGGAVVITQFTNKVNAFIGKNAQVDVGRLVKIDASHTNPFAWDYVDFSSTDAVIDTVYKFLRSGAINTIFTSYVRNGSAGSKFGLAGSVEVRQNQNDIQAYIGQGARINQANNQPDPLLPDITASADQKVRVHASSEINGLHLLGENVGWSKLYRLFTNHVATNERVQKFIDRANALTGPEDEKKFALNQIDPVGNGYGGAIAFFGLGNKAVAHIADGALVKARGNVEVAAEALQRTILIDKATGTSSNLGVHGSAGVVNQNSTAQAYIDDKAIIDAGADLRITAKNEPTIYNIAGGVAKAEATGIGASVALNDVDAVTRAFVGNGTQLSGAPELTFVDSTLRGDPRLRFEAVELSGTPTLTFTDNAFSQSDQRDTISRDVGNWLDEGFRSGQTISIEGSDINDGVYQIEEITATRIILAESEALKDGPSQTLVRRMMSGTPTLTFTDNKDLIDNRDTISRNTGSWISDGFLSGQTIRIEGTGINDGRYVIDSVTSTELKLIFGTQVKSGTARGVKVDTLSITAADTISRTTGSWIVDGFASGQTITVTNAGANNGTYTVFDVSNDQITVSPNQRLVDQTIDSGAIVKAPDSIRRATGSWLADDFKPDQSITVTNAGANNGTYTVAHVSRDVLTLNSAATLTAATSFTAVITDDPLAATGIINVGDVFEINADANPQIYALSLAGAIATIKNEAGKLTQEQGASNPLSGTDTSAATNSPTGSTSAANTDPAKQSVTGLGIAAATAVNFVNSRTLASLTAPVVSTDVLTVKSNNGTSIIAGSGGLSYSSSKSDLLSPPSDSQKAAALAGAFSWNEIASDTDALVSSSGITLRCAPLSETKANVKPERRLSVEAATTGNIWTLAAGLGGAVSKGSANSTNTIAGSLAGSVSMNSINGVTRARIIDSNLNFLAGLTPSDALVDASDDADIFAIAGGLTLAIAKGGSAGSAKTGSVGAAIGVNKISLETMATLENSSLIWDDLAIGKLDVLAGSTGSIKVFTVAGAVAGAMGKQGSSGVAGTGAGSGSVNQVDLNTIAAVRGISTIVAPGAVNIRASNNVEIIAGSGPLSVSLAGGGSGSADAGAVAGSFAINNIGSDADPSETLAELESTSICSGGAITIEAKMDAVIFAVGIVYAGSVSSSTSASSVGVGLAGSIGVNKIRSKTQARIRNDSNLMQTPAQGDAVSVTAKDDSSIRSTAGATDLTIDQSSNSSVPTGGLGISLAINDIDNRLEASISDSGINADGAVTVSSQSTAQIDSQSFGLSVLALINAPVAAMTLDATGALSFNTINSDIQATIDDTTAPGTTSVKSKGTLSLIATDEARIDATAVAASATLMGSQAPSVSVGIGASIATNTIRRNTWAELANFALGSPSGDLVVRSANNNTINSRTIAAAISGAVGNGFSGGLTGGGASSFNTITGNNRALITKAKLGAATGPGSTWNGTVTVSATDTSSINAKVDTITAAGAGRVKSGAAAIGVALARNFIGETQGNSALSGGSPQSFTNLLGDSGNLVRAAITDSNIYAKGAVSVTASNAATISSYVDSFAAALSVTGGISASLVGAGSEATNRSLVAIQAFLGATSGKTISIDSGALNISSSDTSSADTTSWGAAVGASFGRGVSGAAAIGVSLARNTLNNSTATSFENIAAGSKAAALTVTASKAKAANRSGASISAKSAAVAVALSGGSGAGSLAGGGADAINTLLGDATTTITGANLTVAGTLALGTTNSQTADAGVGAGVGAGSATGVGGAIAVGAVKVQNLLGIATADASDNARAKVQTTIVDSNLTTTGINASNPNLSASSSSTASYSALAVPVSVAISTGQFAGAFSGAFNDSRIAYDVQTTVNCSNLVSAGNLAITATTDNEISHVNTDAGNVAASFGAGIAIGAAENKNRIDNIEKVNIGDGGNNAAGTRYVIQSKGDLAINANDIRSSVTQSNATTTTLSAGIIAVSGGGAGVYNTIANTIATTITGAIDINAGVIGDGSIKSATVRPADITIAQVDEITIGHYNYGDVISIKLGSGSVNDTVTYTVNNLTPAAILAGLIAAINAQAGSHYIAATVSADPNSLTITAKTANQPFLSQTSTNSATYRAGSLTIAATSQAARLNSEIINTSVAAGLGAAIGVGVVENRLGNSVLTLTQSSAKTGGTNTPTFAASSNVTIASSSADSIEQAKVISVSASILYGAAVNSAKAINTTTSRSQVQAGSINTPLGTTFVKSTSVNNLNSASYGGVLGGFLGLGVMLAESNLGTTGADAEVQALVGSGAIITAKNVEIISLSRDSVYSDSISAAGGVIGAGVGAQSKATTNQTVQTTIGSGASIKASGNLKLSSLLDQTGEDGNAGGIDSRGEGIAVSGVIAGGGAALTNDIYSKARVDVGSNSQLSANSIDLAAGNSLEKRKYGQPSGNGLSPNANVKVVVAGLAGAAGSSSTTSIGNDAGDFGSAISIGSGATVRASGSKVSPGSLLIHADSDVYATDDGVLDAVSAVAAVFGKSSVTNKAKASVNAASGSQIINDSGDVIITAKSDGTISSSYSVLSGAFGFGESNASAINTTTNSISLDGATIKGQTIKLWAGLDGSGVPNILNSFADSQMNAGVVGIPIPVATATCVDTNTVSVANRSKILARGNVELKAQTKDWSATPTKRSFADATAYILLAVPIPGTKTTNDSTTNTITIDDSSNLVAGSQHQLKLFSLPYTTDLALQNSYLNLTGTNAVAGAVPLTTALVKDTKLTSAQLTSLGLDGSMDYSFQLLASPVNSVVNVGNFIGVVLPDQLWSDSAQRPFLDIVDLGSDLAEDDALLSDLIASYDSSPSDRALYISQREDIRRQADQLDLLNPETGSIQGSLDGLALRLPDLYAAPGSIFLDASGSGGSIKVNPSQIKAYNDASITVSNTARVMLFGDDMVIDDSKVVDVVNGTYTVFNPGALYINRQGGSTGADTAITGTISVIQKVRKNAPLPAGYPATSPPPDLYLTGSVINETGAINISNTTDSVIVSGELRGQTLNINSIGNFSLNSDTWFHTGGDPRQYLNYDSYRSQAFNAGTNSDGTYTGKPTSVTAATSTVSNAAASKAGTIFSRGDISISALYLNIDGLIQSGTQSLGMTVDAGFNPTYSSSLIDSNGNTISGISYATVNGEAVPLAGYVDAATRTIKLNDIKSSGGNITLTGQILSTGAGKVLAFNGQPTLSITNNSTWKLVAGEFNLAPINGKITIVDTPRIALVPTAIDIAANSITFANAHNLVDGSQIIYQFNNSINKINESYLSDSSSPVTGLINNTVYYVEVVNATTIKLKAASNSSTNIDITAWDSAREASFSLATVKKTQYQYSSLSSQFTKSESSLIGAATAYTPPTSTTIAASVSASDSGGTILSTVYNPATGLTYNWTEGQSKTTTTVKYWSETTFNFFFDIPTGERNNWTSINTQFTDGKPLLQGQALQASAPSNFGASSAYQIDYKQVMQDTAQVTTREWTTGGGFLRRKTYHIQQTEIQGVKDYYTHFLKADNPITVGFITPSTTAIGSAAAGAGALTISSQGDVSMFKGVKNTKAVDIGTTNGKSIKGLLVKDGTVPISLNAAGDLDLQVGWGISSTDAINVTASAGGNLTIQTISNGGAIAALKPRADATTGIALSAGKTLTLLLGGGLDTSDQASSGSTAATEFFKADRMEIQVGSGSVGSAANPLRLNTSINGLTTSSGLAVKLTAPGSTASLQETSGDLQLILPTAFTAGSALTIPGDLNLTVTRGDLLNGTGAAINPVNRAVLAEQDATFKITGAEAITAATAEIARQDSINYNEYWTTYRGWSKQDFANNNALVFNGTSFVNVGNANQYRISTGTIEAWIKTGDAGTGNRAIATKPNAYGMYLSGNKLWVYDWKTGTSTSTSVALNDNRWHHVAFSFQSGVSNGSKLYVDGKPVAVNGTAATAFTYTVNNSASNDVLIGGEAGFTSSVFNGSIDEVRVWNVVRSDADIATYSNSPIAKNATNNALVFNGTSFVNVGNANQYRISTGTIEACIKTGDAGTGNRAIATKPNAYGMYLSGNKLWVYDWKTGTSTSTSVALNDNRWHHVAFSFQSGVSNGSKLYVDGKPVAVNGTAATAFTYTVNNSASNDVLIGGEAGFTSSVFNGSIDEVRVWNVVRSDADIATYSNSLIAKNATNLAGYYPIDEASGSLIDYSGNATTVVLPAGVSRLGSLGPLTTTWTAPATAKHTESSFTFTADEISYLKLNKKFSDSAVTSYQNQLSAIHNLYRTASPDPSFVYNRPAADRQAALDQRVVGANAYYYPLASDLYRLLFPKQAEQRGLPTSSSGGSGSGNAAISSANLNLTVSTGAIGRTSDLIQIDIPNGDYEQLSTANAQLLSSASSSDVAGRSYRIYEYIGSSPCVTTSTTASLNLTNTSLFRSYSPNFTAGSGTLYKYVGTTALTNFNLSTADFGAKDSSNRNLWEVVSTGTAKYNTTASSVSLAVNELVMDTRASLINGNVVLVRTPAFYGYYQYTGATARRELLQEDYGNTGRWTALSIGSQNASSTTTNHPLTLTQGTLLTDPFSLTGVTLRLNTAVSVAATGSVSATAGTGIRLSSAGALTVKSVSASGVLNLEATSLAQDSTGSGVTNNRGPIELRSTSGNIGSSASRFKVTTNDVASLFASTAGVGSAYLASTADLALGSLVAAGTLDISSSGALRDAGRNASPIGQARVNLQAPKLNLAAASFGTAVSPLVIGGGSSSQQTTLTATSSAGADGLMAFAAKGSTPVKISSLSINTSGSPSTPAGSIWLSGDGFASVSGTTPVIRAGTLVLDGPSGIGTSSAALRTSINSLAGSVGASGVYLTNNAALTIDSANDRTGNRPYAGLVTGGSSSITTTSGALSLNGAVSATAGNLSLTAASDLLINASGSITTAGSGNLALKANTSSGRVNAASGSQLNLNSTGTATLTASTLVLQGVITTAGNLAFAPTASANLNLVSYLTDAQKQALIDTGVAAASLDGNSSNREITTNLILGGTLTSTNSNGLSLSSRRPLALLGDITTSAGALSLTSTSGDLLVLGNLTALSNLSLSATADKVRTTVPSTLKTTAKTGGSTTLSGSTGAALYGSILAGAESSSSGAAWLAAAATPANLSITSSVALTLAGANAVAGATTITAPTVTITATGGVISRGDLSISATGQGLFSSGLLVAGGTVNTALTALTPSTPASASGSSTTPVRGSTLQAANIVLDAASTARLSLTVSRDAADALVLGGSTSGSGSNQTDLVVAGAWMAAPNVSITAPQSPRILHDLIARNGLTITANSATAANNKIRLSPLAQILLGSSDGSSGTSTVDLNATSINLPGDTAGLAIEALNSAPQDFLRGKLSSGLSLKLAVTRQASGGGTGVETKTFTASVSAQQFTSLSALITAINNAISTAATAAGLVADNGEIPVLDLRGANVRLSLKVPTGSTRLNSSLGLALNSSSSSGLSQLGSFTSSTALQAVTPATILSRAKDTTLNLGSPSQKFTTWLTDTSQLRDSRDSQLRSVTVG